MDNNWPKDATPFRGCLDPGSFYPSPTHEEGLARLHFLVEQRRRLGVLSGGSGSGKSLLFEIFAHERRCNGLPVANVNLVGVGATEMLWLLATGLGLNPDRGLDAPALWRLSADRLREYRYQQLETVLLFDDADMAGSDSEALGQVARLARHDATPEARLTIIVAGRPERMARLGSELLELADLRIDLDNWELADTENYVLAALARSGCQTVSFDTPAIARLHELARGIPRKVSQLADLALLAGAGRRLPTIDAETVESACQELGVIAV
jgi:general secretion pathway protein A